MLISAYWLIPAAWLGVVVGVFVVCLMRSAAAQPDRSEDDPSRKVAKGVPTIHEKGA